MGKDTATSGKVKIFNDAIHAETIKKEMRVHRLYENYMLTPAKVKDLVITNKPTGDPTITGKEMGDEEYLRAVRKRKMKPQELYPMPVTTSQAYGWDTDVLMRNTDRRFHFPRVVSDVSRIGEIIGPKKTKA